MYSPDRYIRPADMYLAFSALRFPSAWTSTAILMYIPKAPSLSLLAWLSISSVLAANQPHTLPLLVNTTSASVLAANQSRTLPLTVNTTGADGQYVNAATSFVTIVAISYAHVLIHSQRISDTLFQTGSNAIVRSSKT